MSLYIRLGDKKTPEFDFVWHDDGDELQPLGCLEHLEFDYQGNRFAVVGDNEIGDRTRKILISKYGFIVKTRGAEDGE